MTHPFIVEFDPVAFGLGPLHVHWYGLMYLGGLVGAWILGERRRRAGRLPVSREELGDLAFYVMMGIIIGGRVWYMLSYQPIHWVWTRPQALFEIWDGGMSFHGGLMGVVLAVWLWSRRHKLHPFDTVDFIAPLVPIGLGLGRIGNFINGELWGKPSHVAWAMIFPGARGEDLAFVRTHPAWLPVLQRYGGLPRHPSELYEFLLEGVVMFTVLYIYSSKPRRRYAVSGLFALMYGCFRFLVEFVRMPDPQLGYLFGTHWVTMGQVQSAPLIVIGVFLLALSRSQPVTLKPDPKPRRAEQAQPAS